MRRIGATSKYGDAYTTLQPRVAKTLLRAFLDPLKPLATHYGAIHGLMALGKHALQMLLLPNVKTYVKLLEPQMRQDPANPTRAADARRCYTALLVRCCATNRPSDRRRALTPSCRCALCRLLSDPVSASRRTARGGQRPKLPRWARDRGARRGERGTWKGGKGAGPGRRGGREGPLCRAPNSFGSVFYARPFRTTCVSATTRWWPSLAMPSHPT